MRIRGLCFSLVVACVTLTLVLTADAGGKKKPVPAATAPEKPPPPVIVIDPGHGGKDPGAISKKKTREKDLVLTISKKLAQSLKRKIGAAVYLTRVKDRFISLGGRDEVANAKSCDLFLSIHANAARSAKPEGLEIYYLNKATDEASRRLAERENEGAPKKEKEIEAIVSDLIQTASTEESAILSREVEKALKRRLKKHKTKSIRIKTALFYVLVGAKCPSLLVEVGFITNPAEEKRLKKGAYQRDLTDGIAEGVARYLAGVDAPGSDL